MWLVTTILDSADREHFHHHRKFYWTALGYRVKKVGPSVGLEISFSRSQESAVEFFRFLYIPATHPLLTNTYVLYLLSGLGTTKTTLIISLVT